METQPKVQDENTSGQPAAEEGSVINMPHSQGNVVEGPEKGPAVDQPPPPSGPQPWIYNGGVPYRLMIDINNNWHFNYPEGILENEIAVLAIAKHIVQRNYDSCANRLQLDKKPTKAEDKLTKDQLQNIKTLFKECANVLSNVEPILVRTQNLYKRRIAAQQLANANSFQQPQPGTESSGKTEETSQTNEIHQNQESGGNSATGDTPPGSQHEEKRPE